MAGIEHQLPKNIERYLAALSRLYAQDGRRALQEIVVNAQTRVVEGWEYDNLDVVPEPLFPTAGRDGYLRIDCMHILCILLKKRPASATKMIVANSAARVIDRLLCSPRASAHFRRRYSRVICRSALHRCRANKILSGTYSCGLRRKT